LKYFQVKGVRKTKRKRPVNEDNENNDDNIHVDLDIVDGPGANKKQQLTISQRNFATHRLMYRTMESADPCEHDTKYYQEDMIEDEKEFEEDGKTVERRIYDN